MNKIISLVLVFAMLVSSTIVMAENPDKLYADTAVKIIKDNDQERIAQSIENGFVITATYDKINNVMTQSFEPYQNNDIVVKQLTSKADKSVVKVEVVDMEAVKIKVENNQSTVRTNTFAVAMLSYNEEKTLSNYEYYMSPDIGDTYQWTLSRPQKGVPGAFRDTRTVWETDSNSKNILQFKKHVDTINTCEFILGGTGVFVIATFWIGGGTVTASALAALGIGAASLTAGAAIVNSWENAEFYFWRMF